jgi:hypothetical protein
MDKKTVSILHEYIIESIFALDISRELGLARCHEMAYLTSFGLGRLGFDSKVVNGLYEDSYNCCQHSWVELLNQFKFGKCILDFHFEKNLSKRWVAECHREVVRFFGGWRYYPDDSRKYKLISGVETFAEEVFKGYDPSLVSVILESGR